MNRDSIDTTTLHNKEWRTSQPISQEREMKWITGYNIFKWEEFESLRSHLGIILGESLEELTLFVPCDYKSIVTTKYKNKSPETQENEEGHTLFHSPEFKAFAKRLNVSWHLPIRDITIFLALDEIATITIKYFGTDTSQPEEKESNKT